MVREICDSPKFESKSRDGCRYITFEYRTNKEDVGIINQINNLLSNLQDRCDNCCHYKSEGCLGNYEACSCDIYGILENVGNPHYDMDGSRCQDYKRK